MLQNNLGMDQRPHANHLPLRPAAAALLAPVEACSLARSFNRFALPAHASLLQLSGFEVKSCLCK